MPAPRIPAPDRTLDEVVDLFWLRGYHDVCIEDIVHSTGLNRHTLYDHFGSKLGLFRAALDRYAEQRRSDLDALLLAEGSPRERLDALVAAVTRSDHPFGSMLRERGCLAARTADQLGRSHPELRLAMDTVGRHLLARVAQVVREGQACGELRSDVDADDAAAVVTACVLAPLAWDGAGERCAAVLALLS